MYSIMDLQGRACLHLNRRCRRSGIAFAAVVGLVAGCLPAKDEHDSGGAAVATAVTVAVPIDREVQDYEEFTGRVAAQFSVEVRARVTGYLERIAFEDGAEVQAGDLLFVIDPRPFQAAHDSAAAIIAVRKASAVFRDAEFNRNKELLAKNSVSRSEYDQSAAALEEAKALVTSAEAEAESAKLNLEFTEIRAPMNGRISSRKVDVGNLVVADQTLLTSLVSVDPMYVNFDVDERRLLRIQRQVREGRIRVADGTKIPMNLGLDDEAGFPHPGTIDFADNQIDPNTGTIRMRAVVPNPQPPQGKRLLVAGMFARVKVPLGDPRRSVLIAEQAIGSDQGQKFVYVVDAQQEVQYRRIKTGRTENGLRVIEDGLQAGERVIVAGLQRVRPGVKVEPQTVEMATFAAPTPETSSADAAAAKTSAAKSEKN